MLDQKGRFIIDDYGKKSTFASFLPGISGVNGIPIWCYYVNRGQCVTSFGIEDKDHAILEFYPAHQAYQITKKAGFRTFLKVNGTVFEPFQREQVSHQMTIGMNELKLTEINEEHHLETEVLYYTLSGEQVGALIRKVTVRNTSDRSTDLEILDGLPAVIPFGVDMSSMKTMGQTTKAWMQVEDTEKGVPYFRVRVSMEDSAAVKKILGGNFGYGITENGEKLYPIVDPDVIFEYDTTLDEAIGFINKGMEGLYRQKQVTQNHLPCCFFGTKTHLAAGESFCIYEIIGQVEQKEILDTLVPKCTPAFFEEKYTSSLSLANDLCRVIRTKTASKMFDEYSRQTYLDNVLRGGFPIILGKNKIFYLYSRKHGDIERDYNYFKMLPEFYSQGNGNFRDVNQNRRSDVLFTPYVGDTGIKTFYSLIQIDGYNPLGVEKITYRLTDDNAKRVLINVPLGIQEGLHCFVKKAFTPGGLAKKLSEYCLDEKNEHLFDTILNAADSEINAVFGEGYWTDHWTYNLDLVESYLNVYPENEVNLLFEDSSYTYFETQVFVNPRGKRYVKTEQGIRQYRALDRDRKKGCTEKLLRNHFGKGEVVTSNLIEKLLLMCTIKTATLDPYGMGIEMEGGKPGWYDALNGLPGIFGSSMAETYELCRMLEFTMEKLLKYQKSVEVLVELKEFMEKLYQIVLEQSEDWKKEKALLTLWEKMNDAKEAYREKTVFGVSGDKEILSASYLLDVLGLLYSMVKAGIEKAIVYGEGISPAYFTYEVTEYEEEAGEIRPLAFEVCNMPFFLEGPVRYLKLRNTAEKKKELYNRVKESGLYDKPLSMYKVNSSLADASYEIGRAKAFTPGWLENESIWMHMEYKYLLEILKSGLYEEYINDFKKAAVPFLDPEMYGRSILENSSFIASSANPDPKIHGKGFVARLSGSTAEFLSIWQIMMFGQTPFTVQQDKLTFALKPVLPSYLVGSGKKVEAVLLGTIQIVYHFTEERDYIPGNYQVQRYEITYYDGRQFIIEEEHVCGDIAVDIRNGKIESIVVYLNS